jgi:hypothetical protein
MRLTAGIALVVSLLVLAAPAAAKEVVAAKVCGLDECRTASGGPAGLTKLAYGGLPASPPERPAGWYRMVLSFRMEGPERMRIPITVIPGEELMRWEGRHGDGGWVEAPAETLAALRPLIAGLEPRHSSTLKVGSSAGPAEARVDEVVAPADEPAPPQEGSSAIPWIAAVAALLLGVTLVLVRRRTTRWSRPSPAGSGD